MNIFVNIKTLRCALLLANVFELVLENRPAPALFSKYYKGYWQQVMIGMGMAFKVENY